VLERSEDQEKLLSAKVQMLFGKIEHTKGKEQPVTERHEEAPNDDDGRSAVDAEPKKRKTNRKGGRNKEADAAVAKIAEEQQHLEEMEEKLKEHWDKKGWE